MLNAKALSEFLSKNSDQRLCKRWHLMTPNGTLLAYTQPADMKELRKQVAMAALSWQDHQQTEADGKGDKLTISTNSQRQLHTLIIESEESNVLLRQIQPELLLVLEGGVPPRKRTFEPRVTAEGADGEPFHEEQAADSALGTSISSRAESSMSNAAGGVLAIHRKKLDAVAAALGLDFEQSGFKMPDGSVNKLF